MLQLTNKLLVIYLVLISASSFGKCPDNFKSTTPITNGSKGSDTLGDLENILKDCSKRVLKGENATDQDLYLNKRCECAKPYAIPSKNDNSYALLKEKLFEIRANQLRNVLSVLVSDIAQVSDLSDNPPGDFVKSCSMKAAQESFSKCDKPNPFFDKTNKNSLTNMMKSLSEEILGRYGADTDDSFKKAFDKTKQEKLASKGQACEGKDIARFSTGILGQIQAQKDLATFDRGLVQYGKHIGDKKYPDKSLLRKMYPASFENTIVNDMKSEYDRASTDKKLNTLKEICKI